MRKGRINKEEQKRRIKLLLRFIFTFKYATRKQLDMFIQSIMNMTYTRRLIAYCLREAYLKSCRERWSKTKIYYLTKKARILSMKKNVLPKTIALRKAASG